MTDNQLRAERAAKRTREWVLQELDEFLIDHKDSTTKQEDFIVSSDGLISLFGARLVRQFGGKAILPFAEEDEPDVKEETKEKFFLLQVNERKTQNPWKKVLFKATTSRHAIVMFEREHPDLIVTSAKEVDKDGNAVGNKSDV